MQTHWAETVRNPELQRQINVHQGHSWATVRAYYTYHDQAASGQAVSNLVNEDMAVAFLVSELFECAVPQTSNFCSDLQVPAERSIEAPSRRIAEPSHERASCL